MRNLKYPVMMILLLICCSTQAFGKVYIDIDSPSFQKLPIAVADFLPSRPAGDKGDLSIWFPDTLSRNLAITGFFNVLERKGYPVEPKQEGTKAEKISFEAWAAIGAEYLVKGEWETGGHELVITFRLFDVARGEQMLEKRYAGKIDDRERMAVRFVNEILQSLTGETGLFDTRIAFVRKSNGSADIYSINFDGSDLRRVTDDHTLNIAPRWSKDGRFLAFTSYREGNPDLYIRDLENGSTRKLSYYKGLNLPGSWSLDGTRLLVTLSRDGNQEIYDMDVGNSLLLRLTHNFAILPTNDGWPSSRTGTARRKFIP
jgi:TolB protein